MNISNYHCIFIIYSYISELYLTNFEFINCNFLFVNVEISEKRWSYSEAKTFEFGRGLLDIIYAKKTKSVLKKRNNSCIHFILAIIS